MAFTPREKHIQFMCLGERLCGKEHLLLSINIS